MKKILPLLFVIISTLVLITLVILIDHGDVFLFDTWFYNGIASRMNPRFTITMRFITESGSSIAVIILCLSFFFFKKTRDKWAFPVSLSVIIATIINTLMKLVFARERPNILRLIEETNYSFPSGHAMINTAFYMMLLLLTWQHIKNKWIKYTISIICITMPLLIGLSRIYLGVHYASDVVAGWIIGFIISIIVFQLFKQGSRVV